MMMLVTQIQRISELSEKYMHMASPDQLHYATMLRPSLDRLCVVVCVLPKNCLKK